MSELPRESTDPDFAGVTCPHCASADVFVVSLFGSSVSEVMFQCRTCRTIFNWVKLRGRLPPCARRSSKEQ